MVVLISVVIAVLAVMLVMSRMVVDSFIAVWAAVMWLLQCCLFYGVVVPHVAARG